MLDFIKGALRTVNAALLFAVFGLGALFLSVIVFSLIELVIKDPKKRTSLSRKFTAQSFRIYLKIGVLLGIFKISFKDKEKLKSDKGVMYIANHPTLLDYVLIASVVPSASCVVKDALLKNFFVRGIIRCNDYISNLADHKSMMEKCSELINNGGNLLIFPEGTRTLDDKHLKFIHGFSSLALNCGFNIRPLSIKFKGRALRKGAPFYLIYFCPLEYEIKVHDIFDTKAFAQDHRDLMQSAVSRRLSKELNQFVQQSITETNKNE